MSANPSVVDKVMLGVETADGPFLAVYTTRGLCGLSFPGRPARAPGHGEFEAPPPIRAWHALTTSALNRALRGEEPGKLPPLDLSSGTPFQRQVWRALLGIARGQTSTYSSLANAVGRPGAARAVGAACGANPVPVLVPCHRVIAVHQRLGGFSAPLDWKRKLLGREGVAFRDPHSGVQKDLF